MPTPLWFVAGAIGGTLTGYVLARLPGRAGTGEAHVPQHVRLAMIAPTHPAQRRPVLFDQDDVA